VLLPLLLLISAACVANPQRIQMEQLLQQLGAARAALAEVPPRTGSTCDAVGDVESRLLGEPGLVDVKPAWSSLHDGAVALLAVCGQASLLEQPAGSDSAAWYAARARWQAGLERELGVACDHLEAAADALQQPAPC
jgi:hypothetical protein